MHLGNATLIGDRTISSLNVDVQKSNSQEELG